jgi:LacI family transcriptional regulator
MLPRSRRRPKQAVTLQDVARHAGVSPKTVSNVLNDWPYVTDETRQKVQQAIADLGYRPSVLATSLRTGQTKTIGVVIPDITNPFFGQAVRGCEDVLYTAGYSIFLCNTNEDPVKERGYLDMLVSRGVDGLLMFGARSSAEVLSSVVYDWIPIVAEDSPAQHSNTTVVEIDNVTGARLGTAHLLHNGRRRVGHLAGPAERLAAQHRLEGYRLALADAGLADDPALVVHGHPSIRGGYQAALKLIEGQHPTALFCYNDLMAIGAMIACRHLGLAIPQDLALVGFDDVAIASLVVPALTTIRVCQYLMGRTASELLLERLAGKESPTKHVLFPVELIERDSSGGVPLSSEQTDHMLEALATAELADLDPCEPTEASRLDQAR